MFRSWLYSRKLKKQLKQFRAGFCWAMECWYFDGWSKESAIEWLQMEFGVVEEKSSFDMGADYAFSILTGVDNENTARY